MAGTTGYNPMPSLSPLTVLYGYPVYQVPAPVGQLLWPQPSIYPPRHEVTPMQNHLVGQTLLHGRPLILPPTMLNGNPMTSTVKGHNCSLPKKKIGRLGLPGVIVLLSAVHTQKINN